MIVSSGNTIHYLQYIPDEDDQSESHKNHMDQVDFVVISGMKHYIQKWKCIMKNLNKRKKESWRMLD